MVEEDVELGCDWEGGGGVEGEESNPQLVDVLLPFGAQLETKDALIELLDFEENIKVQDPNGVIPHQRHKKVQVGKHLPNLGPLVVPLLALVTVGLDPKKIVENCLDLWPGTLFKVI